MLEVRELSLQTGSFSLHNINLTVDDLQCHVILGPTGSGKTLFLETIVGFRNPETGSVKLNGKELLDLPVEKREISYVPQDLALFPHLSVGANILYPLRMKGDRNGTQRKLVDSLLDSVGIRSLLKRSTRHLSGGERQRVAFVRALAAGNKYLLLDEPLSALHEGMRKELWFLLRELQRKFEFTILMVTHSLEEAFFLGDRLSVIIDGAIRQSGSKQAVYECPKTLEVARFFGIRNLFEASVADLNKGVLSLHCPELNTTLSGPAIQGNDYPKGMQMTIGIRAKDMKILTKEDPVREEESRLDGRITTIIEKGESRILLFVPEASHRAIEVEVGNDVFEELGPINGNRLSLSLNHKRIFLLEAAPALH
jgi:ABC-type Fe3+/spermidine/putrescine transport system ATPase subunit